MKETKKMNRPLRLTLIAIPLVLLLAVIVAAIALATIIRRPFPKTSGTLRVPGLQAEVEVYRDAMGVPHIYAQNQDDLFFAQGYIHAQDRFWQMEFWRHVGQGRISEIVGADGVENDKFIRNIGWNRIAADTLARHEAEDPDLMAILNAYSAGVNAYIEQNRNSLSLNYTILGLAKEPWPIEPWRPLDTISWGTVMAWDLGGNWRHEQTRLLLQKGVGEAMVTALLPPYPANRPIIAPTEIMTGPVALAGGTTAVAVGSTAVAVGSTAVDWDNLSAHFIGKAPADGFALGAAPFAGSNSWVVAGKHSASGQPLLANDPHLAIQMPSIWYMVGLHAPGWEVTGFSFAGAPGVVIGHNGRIAWGVTTAPVDVQDLFIEKINPNNPHQYEFRGQWRDMVVLEEVIKVNGGEDVIVPVRLTHHGPILNEARDGIHDVLAFSWTAFTPSRLFKGVIELNQAQNYEQFRTAVSYWDTAIQNIVYADVAGNIAYQLPGRLPIRRNGDGLLPVPGWTGEYEWEGWIPYDELPALFNPESGYIVAANNAVVDDEYPHFLSYYWADGNRAQRIEDMLNESLAGGRLLSPDDFGRIQNDNYSLLAAEYVPLFSGLNSSNPQEQAALERMRGWDYQLRRDSVPAALFEIFYMQLAPAVLADELGDVAEEYLTHSDPQRVFFHALARQPAARWWDNVQTPQVETRAEILLQAVGATVAWLEQNIGPDMNEWTWGRLHTATFVSAPLGQSGIKLVETAVNRGPLPADGGSSIVNANGWSWSEPAVVRGHVSMRMIVDFDQFDATLVVIPTGQSGHPYHRHYDDFVDLWLNGRYHTMLFNREAVTAASTQRLLLQPPKN
jgi:penicillin G amidase